MHSIHRRIATGIATATVALTLLAAPASAAGPAGRHRHHESFGLTRTQRTCMAEHGFGVGHRVPDFRRASVRRAFVAALHDCGVGRAPEPTTTTTTGPPIIIS